MTHFSAHNEAVVKSHRERVGGEKERPPKNFEKVLKRDGRWERSIRKDMNLDSGLPL